MEPTSQKSLIPGANAATTASASKTLPATVDSKPPTGKQQQQPAAKPFASDDDYDDFTTASEVLMPEQQKRPLQFPTTVTITPATDASGDYDNQELVDKERADVDVKVARETPSNVAAQDAIDKQATPRRESFGSDYEEPLNLPQHISSRGTFPFLLK